MAVVLLILGWVIFFVNVEGRGSARHMNSSRTSRFKLISSAPVPIVGPKTAAKHGIGGFETGSFVKVGSTYHAFVNELPNLQPYSHCPELWWDATTQLGHWSAQDVIHGPWTRIRTLRQPLASLRCDPSLQRNSSACADIAAPPTRSWLCDLV